MQSFIIQQAHWEQMQTHVEETAPVEACGLLAGKGNTGLGVFPITNELASSNRYRMAPEEQVRALHTIFEKGWDLLAIYHSHPDGPAKPSQTDLREAHFKQAIQLIWSREGGQWSMQAFRFSSAPAKLQAVTYTIERTATESAQTG